MTIEHEDGDDLYLNVPANYMDDRRPDRWMQHTLLLHVFDSSGSRGEDEKVWYTYGGESGERSARVTLIDQPTDTDIFFFSLIQVGNPINGWDWEYFPSYGTCTIHLVAP
jgi:hypothetical protein